MALGGLPFLSLEQITSHLQLGDLYNLASSCPTLAYPKPRVLEVYDPSKKPTIWIEDDSWTPYVSILTRGLHSVILDFQWSNSFSGDEVQLELVSPCSGVPAPGKVLATYAKRLMRPRIPPRYRHHPEKVFSHQVVTVQHHLAITRARKGDSIRVRVTGSDICTKNFSMKFIHKPHSNRVTVLGEVGSWDP
jgi:hypothetical protein